MKPAISAAERGYLRGGCPGWGSPWMMFQLPVVLSFFDFFNKKPHGGWWKKHLPSLVEKKWDGLGKQNKMLGETYLTKKTQPKRDCWLKKPVCLFVCLFLPRWIDLYVWKALGFGWDPKADRADLPHIVEVLVPPQRSTDVPSPRWLGAPKINSSPLNIGNPKRKGEVVSQARIFRGELRGGGMGRFFVEGWRMEIM